MKNTEFNLESYKEHLINYIANLTVFNSKYYAFIPKNIENIIKDIHLLAATSIAVLYEQNSKIEVNKVIKWFNDTLKKYLQKIKREYCKYYNLSDSIYNDINWNLSLKEFYKELEIIRKKKSDNFEKRLTKELNFPEFSDRKEREIISYWKLLSRCIANLTGYENLDNIVKKAYYNILKNIVSYRQLKSKLKELEEVLNNIDDLEIIQMFLRLKEEFYYSDDFDNIFLQVEQIETSLKQYYLKKEQLNAIAPNKNGRKSML